MFQSPSLRGSGRFRSPQGGGARRKEVSIPFIAGQWSLRDGTPSPPKGGRVSIPFIAGQWSLLTDPDAPWVRFLEFQSPSLRGSGRFPWATSCSGSSPRCFNPLHCGAVVASHPAARRGGKERKVSIPFIAGQWSLLRPRDTLWSVIALFQSPSLRGSGRFAPTAPCRRPRWSSFNPLHCGAVVASGPRSFARSWTRPFQSPSLRGSGRFEARGIAYAAYLDEFQSPSLRGSGRFAAYLDEPPGWRLVFQSPSLRGSGRFAQREAERAGAPRVSIPFIAGQWSLPDEAEIDQFDLSAFQSPSLRGSGRFHLVIFADEAEIDQCFNPLHCGAVVASHRRAGPGHGARRVSIPFIAGQWSLPSSQPLGHPWLR